MAALYRKRPVVISAVQWNGKNIEEVEAFVGGKLNWRDDKIVIETLEGPLTASLWDFIIEGVKKEHYACKPDIFDQTYERV